MLKSKIASRLANHMSTFSEAAEVAQKMPRSVPPGCSPTVCRSPCTINPCGQQPQKLGQACRAASLVCLMLTSLARHILCLPDWQKRRSQLACASSARGSGAPIKAVCRRHAVLTLAIWAPASRRKAMGRSISESQAYKEVRAHYKRSWFVFVLSIQARIVCHPHRFLLTRVCL